MIRKPLKMKPRAFDEEIVATAMMLAMQALANAIGATWNKKKMHYEADPSLLHTYDMIRDEYESLFRKHGTMLCRAEDLQLAGKLLRK